MSKDYLIKVMSLNLRYDKPDPGNNAWTVRKAAVAALINSYAPDIIGTQEGKAHQLLDLHRLLPDYQSVGGDRTGTGTDEHCAIFYHTQRIKCLVTGDFSLSDTPEIPGSISSTWGNSLPRMVSWAVFAAGGEQKTIALLNTHLDYESPRSRELSVALIRDHLSNFNPAETYLMITGDFNAEPGSVTRQALEQPLLNGLHLQDVLADVELEQQLSFHDFTGKAFVAIDTIYCDSRLSLRDVKVDTGQWEGIWPSDHFSVAADFVFALSKVSST